MSMTEDWQVQNDHIGNVIRAGSSGEWRPTELPLAEVLEVWDVGDSGNRRTKWETWFKFLWTDELEYMNYLLADITENGIKTPITLGPDGKVWNGHHRLAIADALGLEYVPVEISSTTPPVLLCGTTSIREQQ